MTATNQQISETLEWLKVTALDGTEFVKQEAPLWAHELLTYAAYGGWISLVISLLVLLVSGVVLYKGTKFFYKLIVDEGRNMDSDGLMVVGVFLLWICVGLFAVLPAFTFAWSSCDQLLKVYTAPRVYIVENLPKF